MLAKETILENVFFNHIQAIKLYFTWTFFNILHTLLGSERPDNGEGNK